MISKRDVKHSFIKRNYFFLFIGIAIFLMLSIRLAYLQFTEGQSLQVSADSQYNEEYEINNVNFFLLDNQGNKLANSTIKYFVVVDPITFYTLNDDNDFVAMKNISYILRSYNKKFDITLLQSEMDKGKVKYEVDEETYNKIIGIDGIKGIYAYEFNEYDLPMNWNVINMLSHMVKYSDNTKLKDEGTLESEIYNYVKDNEGDKFRIEEDVSKNVINKEVVVNPNNRNVVTTLNKTIQESVQAVLRNDTFKDHDQIGAIIMDSQNGDILAMAQKDDNLSNVNIGIPSGNGFLLGSTFKTIVYESALSNEIVTTDEVFNLKGIFPDSIEKRSSYNIHEAYVASSNDVFAQIGWRVGIKNLYNTANNLGFFDTVLNLQDERKGTIEDYGVKDDSEIITNTAIGQTVRATPLAALSIPNTIINKGQYVKPRIIKKIIDNVGNSIEEFEVEKRQVIDPYIADNIKKSMVDVVNDDLGTGYNARISDLEVGGKTGTSEYLENGKKCSDGWFAGFFKYNNKYYSIVVFLPQSKELQGDSKVACTVFNNIVNCIVEKKLL
ncbi:MAG: penicillin-binding transpeptidase domain-containing protein [Clostridium sp.]|nr:penicillin-binding transpeptidase domain-containing protein [Clostridium sp.]